MALRRSRVRVPLGPLFLYRKCTRGNKKYRRLAVFCFCKMQDGVFVFGQIGMLIRMVGTVLERVYRGFRTTKNRPEKIISIPKAITGVTVSFSISTPSRSAASGIIKPAIAIMVAPNLRMILNVVRVPAKITLLSGV